MADGATATVTRHFDLEPRPPFRLELTAWALRRRPENRIDDWDGEHYRRVTVIDGESAAIAARQAGPAEKPVLRVTTTTGPTLSEGRTREAVSALLGRVLGLDLDTKPFSTRVKADPVVGPLATRFRGVKPPRLPTIFECLVNAVACQQLTLQVGILLLDRLAAAYGHPGWDRPEAHAFPEPESLAAAEPSDLLALGYSRAKARAIVELAARTVAGEIDERSLEAADDDAAVAQLLRLRGIGRWSAEYALLRGLGRVHVFPGDDVGARNNLARRLGIEGPLDYAAVRDLTARWDPFAGFVYFHLLLERIEANGWLRA